MENELATFKPEKAKKFVYKYVNVFKNPNNLPINQIHLERSWFQIRPDLLPKDLDLTDISDVNLQTYYEKKTEIIPALDKNWLPKCSMPKFEPYVFVLPKEDNETFLANNVGFIEGLEYLLKCNFHQFWCTIQFEPSAVVSLRSFLLNPIPWYQVNYLEGEFADVYKTVFNKFLGVYKRLLTFKQSKSEYLNRNEALRILYDKKLLNLPIVITLAFLYKSSNLDFVNELTSVYFDDTSQLDFQIKEVEESINQTLIILEMIGGHVCGFDRDAVIVPVSITERPPVFSLPWVYSVVNYLLNTVCLLHTLLQFYKPATEICLNKALPFRLPFTYVSVYRELYEMLNDREELQLNKELSDKIFDEINFGRSEFVDVYNFFITYCLDKTLENIGDAKQQEYVETYLKLLTTALEDDYFICDYNLKYNVANMNEMFESCYPLDTTRTEFITSCIQKLPRQKRLGQLSNLKKVKLEDIFKEFKPFVVEKKEVVEDVQPGPSNKVIVDDENIESMIKDIQDMFPHLGDGFILKCLEVYDFSSSDVINSILEENLPPHLYETPFDMIRIPPEPEPEKPILAYKGKKPDYDDTLKLLNDKSDLQALKTFVLEGVQYNNDFLYDDEYDDRYDDDIRIKVADNVLEEEIPPFDTSNPNCEDLASDTSYSSDEFDDDGKPVNSKQIQNGKTANNKNEKSRINFCEDPAVIRERREARFQSKYPNRQNGSLGKSKVDVVGKAKGQGQEKSVLNARDKKSVNKSSRANHNRKGGAQWKRNKGMIPS